MPSGSTAAAGTPCPYREPARFGQVRRHLRPRHPSSWNAHQYQISGPVRHTSVLRLERHRLAPAAHASRIRPKGAPYRPSLPARQQGSGSLAVFPTAKKGTSELALHWTGNAWITKKPAPGTDRTRLHPRRPGARRQRRTVGDQRFPCSARSRFLHYSHGAWSAPIRSRWQLLGLAPVPRTKSTWAISEKPQFHVRPHHPARPTTPGEPIRARQVPRQSECGVTKARSAESGGQGGRFTDPAQLWSATYAMTARLHPRPSRAWPRRLNAHRLGCGVPKNLRYLEILRCVEAVGLVM